MSILDLGENWDPDLFHKPINKLFVEKPTYSQRNEKFLAVNFRLKYFRFLSRLYSLCFDLEFIHPKNTCTFATPKMSISIYQTNLDAKKLKNSFEKTFFANNPAG